MTGWSSRERNRLRAQGAAARARRRRRRPRRLDTDAGRRSGRQARGADLPPAGQGLRPRARRTWPYAEAGADLAGFILVEDSPRRAADVLLVPSSLLGRRPRRRVRGSWHRPRAALRAAEGSVRGRDAVLLQDGEVVARALDLPWEEATRSTRPRGACRRAGDARGRLGPDNVRRAIKPCGRAVDAASQLEREPGVKDPTRCAWWRRRDDHRPVRDVRRALRPETLIRPLTSSRPDGTRLERTVFQASSTIVRLRRPAHALTLAERFAPGKRLYLKREDLPPHRRPQAQQHTRPGPCKRLGKRRIVAETGAASHGVATATVCARFGFECVVYMGAEDMERQRPNVERMHLLGAEARPVEFGTKTLRRRRARRSATGSPTSRQPTT